VVLKPSLWCHMYHSPENELTYFPGIHNENIIS